MIPSKIREEAWRSGIQSGTIPEDCKPAHDGERIIEITDKPDRNGKHQWCLYWRSEGKTKAQFFRATLKDFLINQRAKFSVRIIDRTETH